MPFIAMAAMPRLEEKLRAGTMIRGMGAFDAQAKTKVWQAAYDTAIKQGVGPALAMFQASNALALTQAAVDKAEGRLQEQIDAEKKAATDKKPGGGWLDEFTKVMTAIGMTSKVGVEVGSAFKKPVAAPVQKERQQQQQQPDNTMKYLSYGLIGLGVVALGVAGYLALSKPAKATPAAATAANPRRRRRKR